MAIWCNTYSVGSVHIRGSAVDGSRHDAGRSAGSQGVSQSQVSGGGRARDAGVDGSRNGGADDARRDIARGRDGGRGHRSRGDSDIGGGQSAVQRTVELTGVQTMVLGLTDSSQRGDQSHGELVDGVHFGGNGDFSTTVNVWRKVKERGGTAKSIRREKERRKGMKLERSESEKVRCQLKERKEEKRREEEEGRHLVNEGRAIHPPRHLI